MTMLLSCVMDTFIDIRKPDYYLLLISKWSFFENNSLICITMVKHLHLVGHARAQFAFHLVQFSMEEVVQTYPFHE